MTTSSLSTSIPLYALTNENINTAVEEMRIFHKNNNRSLGLSNVPYSNGVGTSLNDPQKYASFTGYDVSGTYGTTVDLSNLSSSEKAYYTNYGTNKYCNNDSECTGTYQSDTEFNTFKDTDLTLTNNSNNDGTTLLLCSADGTTCEDNFYINSNMSIVSDNGVIKTENDMGGQDPCSDSCNNETSCVGYNYDDTNDICTTYSSIDSINSTNTGMVTGVKMDSGDFIEKFSNDDIPNLSIDNTEYLDTIKTNQQITLDNLKDITSENELRNRKFNDLIETKKDIANTLSRSLEIEQEDLIYKNKIVYSIISLIFVAIMVIIVLYKIAK